MNFVNPPKNAVFWTHSLEFSLGRVEADVSEWGVRQIRLVSGPNTPSIKPLPGNLEPLVNWLNLWPLGPEPQGVPLVSSPSPWQISVWERLLKIPLGETRTYGEIAREMGRPTAARAVARACASNSWCLLIPCHRVLGAGGAISGYRWGTHWKPKLIQREWEVSGF